MNGKIIGIFNAPCNISLSQYNRKSKEGSLICIVSEDNRVFLINSENLTIIKSLYFNNNSILNIKQNSKITSINFEYSDTLFFGLSDGSIIKYKFNEEPINLKYDSQAKNTSATTEDEFDNIKCIFSTDRLMQNYDPNSNLNGDFADYNLDNLGMNYNNNEILIPENDNQDNSFLTKSSENSAGDSFNSGNSKGYDKILNVEETAKKAENNNVENLDANLSIKKDKKDDGDERRKLVSSILGSIFNIFLISLLKNNKKIIKDKFF